MFWWLASNTVTAAALAAAVALLCRLGRFRPAVRHALWLLVLIKLVAPPLVELPWAPPPAWFGSQETAVLAAEPQPEAAFPESPPLTREAHILPPEEAEPVSGDAIGPERREAVLAPQVQLAPEAVTAGKLEDAIASWPERLGPWLVGVWLAAGLGMTAVQLGRVHRFRRLLKRGTPAPRRLVRQVEDLARVLGIRAPAAWLVPGIGTPMVWGLGRPKLLWPAILLERLSDDCQRAVLVHELAHLRRRDHWVAWLQLAAGCLWWWHPLYRAVIRRVRASAELACDAWVVETLPSLRRAYAEALLEVSQTLSRSTVPAPALGMAAAGQDFERRLVMIMRESTPCRLPARGLLLVGLAAVLAVPGWSLSQQVIEVRPTETRRQTQREFEVQLLDGVGVTEARPDSQVLNVQLDAGESRIDRLERQLETLLKEVREIKKGGNAGESAKAKGMGLAQEYSVLLDHASATVVSGTESIVLSRVTYKMPRAKAEALAAFLKDQVKASVLETAVEGDLLSVTSTPEAQKTIGQFISLVTGKADGSLQMHYKAPLRAAEPSKP